MTEWIRNPAVWLGAALAGAAIYGVVATSGKEPELRYEPVVVGRQVSDVKPTTGHANWWCMDRAACSHAVEVCDSKRRQVWVEQGLDQQCTGVNVAACLTVERVLDKERARECYATIAICETKAQDVIRSQPLDMKIVEDCVGE